ncbi:MAG: hypothetical protein ACFFCF_09470 [Promethearchaeota archaeon]
MILSEFPNSIIVKYGSPHFSLIFWRAISDVIYVAHGSEKGVAIGSHEIHWTDFARLALCTPSGRQYFASCYSQEAAQFVSSIRSRSLILGFDGVVDAELASLCIIALMHSSRGNLELAINSFFQFFELVVAKALIPKQYRFLPLAVIDLAYFQAPWWVSGFGFTAGFVDGRATLGGAYYSGNWYSGSYVMAMSGPYVLTIPGNGVPALHQSALPYAIASWLAWATGQWYSDPYVYYMTIILSSNQRFMLAVPAFASAMIYFVSFGSSLGSLLGLFVALVLSLFNTFLSLISPYIPFVQGFLNDPGVHTIFTLILNFIDPGSFFYSLLAWDICRPR